MRAPRLGLGIDAGGTATRWQVATAAGRPIAGGSVGPLSGHIFSAAAEAYARDIVAAIAEAAAPAGRLSGIVAGITGLTREAPAVGLMQRLLAAATGVPEDRIFVAEDTWIAYLSHFAPGEGILVYSGTGSVGYHLTVGREPVQVGGRGNLIDDGGSGFWIAREALKSVIRADEERPGSGWGSALGASLSRETGGSGWNEVRAYVYGGDRGRIGGLARAVAEAAASGDRTALAILDEAGRELARLARSLAARIGVKPVALTGRASRLHPAIVEAFAAALPPGTEIAAADADAALTAARLAAAL